MIENHFAWKHDILVAFILFQVCFFHWDRIAAGAQHRRRAVCCGDSFVLTPSDTLHMRPNSPLAPLGYKWYVNEL